MSDCNRLTRSPPRTVLRGVALSSAFCLAALALPAGAEMYKWVDENGNVHYTQERPPPGIEGQAIKPPPEVDTESARKQLESRQKLLNDAQDARAKSADETRKAAEDQAFNEENCRRAR
ncbi:MAG: DUF4124 domain-containing protein, partial [Gammaproteobacteria bacterium]|nr:DUF4124 domain-containing protein [Gammaproteobacteria bacterium]